MNDDTIREKTDLELEREELNLLVKQGIKFSVTHKIRRHKKGVKGFFQRPEVITVKEDFEIQEPTLSVLDRLSAIWVEMGCIGIRTGDRCGCVWRVDERSPYH